MLRVRQCCTRSCSRLKVGAVSTRLRTRGLLTLAIETSCDDTSVAIVEKSDHPHENSKRQACMNGAATLHFHRTYTADNAKHKGIHPIEALESHRQTLSNLLNESLQSLPDVIPLQKTPGIVLPNGARKRKPDFISVTRGPGMRNNLACGLDTAKGLSVAWQIPLVAVHHMQAHALTPRLYSAIQKSAGVGDTARPDPDFPFLSLLVSGGHTMLLHSESLTEHTHLVDTRDIAIGDALDKIGRLLLSDDLLKNIADTAFAKHLSNYAFGNPDAYAIYEFSRRRQEEIQKPANCYGWSLQLPLANTKELAFSFSGIASRIQSLFEERQRLSGGISPEERLMFARTALGISFEHLASKTILALENLDTKGQAIQALVVGGGVAANSFLRHVLREMLDSRGFKNIKLYFPPPSLCTDNAAMIGWAGIEMFEAGWRSSLTCLPLRKWSLGASDDAAEGFFGVGGWVKEEEGTAVDQFFDEGKPLRPIR